ncbi:MAG: arsenate reductase ArsC [Planctomycetes bacterium]|nr:arsenate reductase ArsC [Planctomycetota bacterium]
MKSVLFLCTGNSCRSQMGEGWLRRLGGDRFEGASAGTEPSVVNPMAIEVMEEAGVDLSGHRSKHLREFSGRHFDFVVTVCDRAKESCPIFPGAPTLLHWSIPDPAAFTGTEKERLRVFRDARDEIRDRIRQFLEDVEGNRRGDSDRQPPR